MKPTVKKPGTKIIATVGPACQQQDQLAALVTAGVDIFRVNMAHGRREQHENIVQSIRAVSRQLHRPLGILVDLSGPKIRLGQLAEEPTTCDDGQRFRFIRGDAARGADELVSNYAPLIDELSVGDVVMLADGTVSMRVVEKSADSALSEVVESGLIRSRQGINLPGVKLSVRALTDDDIDCARWAAEAGVDFVGLSFVRRPEDIQQLQELMREHGSLAMVVAKIEKQEAVNQLVDIVLASDAVMIARGDLGVETDVAEMPVVQKRIIKVCNQLGKPVIVATQMLDSMQRSRRPTRAEATDVANAILDGADACMLSGETAIGEYPQSTVEMMQRIISSTESAVHAVNAHEQEGLAPQYVHPITSAVVTGTARVARQLNAALMVVRTRSGATALAMSKLRHKIPTVAVSDNEQVLRQMCLLRGITPVADAPALEGAGLREFIDDWGRRCAGLSAGDRVVMVSGTGIEPGAHNQIVVHEVN